MYKSLVKRSQSLVQRGERAALVSRPSVNARTIARRNSGEALPKHVTLQEVAAAIAAMPGGPLAPARLFVHALWQSGARVSELLQARVGDLNFADGTLRLPTLKRGTGAARLVALEGDLTGLLAQYIAAGLPKDRKGFGSQARLWPRGRAWAWNVVHRAFTKVGVENERAHPHALRHGHGVHAHKHGVALTAIQETMGHATIQTTAIYSRLNLQERREAYRRAGFEVPTAEPVAAEIANPRDPWDEAGA